MKPEKDMINLLRGMNMQVIKECEKKIKEIVEEVKEFNKDNKTLICPKIMAEILKNENAIRRSVRNIVETIPTERFFNSLLGSDVRDSLFEFVDFGTASVIQSQILVAIENFEPRVDNVVVEVNPQPDQNSFDVTVIFDIIGQEFPTQEYTFLLEATR